MLWRWWSQDSGGAGGEMKKKMHWMWMDVNVSWLLYKLPAGGERGGGGSHNSHSNDDWQWLREEQI